MIARALVYSLTARPGARTLLNKPPVGELFSEESIPAAGARMPHLPQAIVRAQFSRHPVSNELWQVVCIVGRQSPTGQFKIEGETENEEESSEKGIEAGQREAVEVRTGQPQGLMSAPQSDWGGELIESERGCHTTRGSPFRFQSDCFPMPSLAAPLAARILGHSLERSQLNPLKKAMLDELFSTTPGPGLPGFKSGLESKLQICFGLDVFVQRITIWQSVCTRSSDASAGHHKIVGDIQMKKTPVKKASKVTSVKPLKQAVKVSEISPLKVPIS